MSSLATKNSSLKVLLVFPVHSILHFVYVISCAFADIGKILVDEMTFRSSKVDDGSKIMLIPPEVLQFSLAARKSAALLT
ncbi:unnamed protein product [Cuscuta epithymum]|uniref:Uncharacterized protein n=1 Tax=Cuscuta epithymum TaxID=186058 RepID=A0AAV0F197_9ASTE|nr:unnamed protein product [Cuscuta epithymum]